MGLAPHAISETSFPVTGPSVTPIIACPVAKIRLFIEGARPIMGNPSGVKGRRPHQMFSATNLWLPVRYH